MTQQSRRGDLGAPDGRALLSPVASFARLILVDRRGTGLSDPLRSRYAGGDFGPWIEEAASDVVTVLDATGSQRTALVSNAWGVSVAISLAATFPDRCRRSSWSILVLFLVPPPTSRRHAHNDGRSGAEDADRTGDMSG